MKEIKSFPYSASHSSHTLTTEEPREAEVLLGSILRCIRVTQELHAPTHMHGSQAFPHYAISWNVLPLQTTLGLLPHLAEVPMHSPSKTHKQATHTEKGSLQDRSCGRWLASLACMHSQKAVRAMSESLEEVRREGLCGRGWWRRSSHSCHSDWISDSGLWLSATEQESWTEIWGVGVHYHQSLQLAKGGNSTMGWLTNSFHPTASGLWEGKEVKV